MKYDALILAGGKLEDTFRQFGDVPNKAFLPLGGRCMAEYVVEALVNSEMIGRVFLVAPAKEISMNFISGVICGGKTLFESLCLGLRGIPNPTKKVLIVASDLPLLSPKSICNFISNAKEFEADLYYPFVERGDSEARFPDLPHTWLKLKEGVFCGGGVVLVNPERFKDLSELAKKVTTYRKAPWRLVALFGLLNMIKFAMRCLKVKELEKKGTQLLGFPVKGIQSHDPEIAFNVDDAEGFLRAAQALGVSPDFDS